MKFSGVELMLLITKLFETNASISFQHLILNLHLGVHLKYQNFIFQILNISEKQ